MSTESYKHQYAKNTLAGWLREICAGKVDQYVTLKPLHWRVNRSSPNFGVWVEYPVCIDAQNKVMGIQDVWDENFWWEYDKNEKNPRSARAMERPPTYAEVIGEKYTPVVIFDIAIQHKGLIATGIEVVHKNGISATKAEYLKRIAPYGGLEVLTIDADWILSRVKRPDELVCKRIL